MNRAPDPAAKERFAAGLRAADAGDLETALERLEEAAALAPESLRYSAEYRQVAIELEEYDRAIAFFEELAAEHPDSAAVRLNWGYAYVDKIPSAGAVTQVILANTALEHFTEAIEREESWLALYTRGNSYVYWPPVFGRTELAIADLERAVALSEEGEPKPYHVHAYAALGDAWWRKDDLERAREVWRRGLDRFPDAESLEERLELDAAPDGGALDRFLETHYQVGNRVDTSLRELWEAE
ncbi:MAG: tetratricopeptide repeat protein [Acidobacteriota bacterium]